MKLTSPVPVKGGEMFRFAVLADVHASLPAMEAVLDNVAEQGVDAVILAGDFITGGPAPSQVLDLVTRHVDHVILGNADIRLLDFAKGDAPESWEWREQWAAMQWTLDQLSPTELEILNRFPETQVIELGGRASIHIVHGSPRSYNEHILPNHDPQTMVLFKDAGLLHTERIEVRQALILVPEAVLICGHSHIPWQYGNWGKLIINPGSVGAPIDGDICAHYMLLEGDGDEWHAELRLVEYDLDWQYRLYCESGFLYEGGAVAWTFLRSIQTGRNVTGRFLNHVENLAVQMGYSGGAPVPEHIWGRAVETFNWDQSN